MLLKVMKLIAVLDRLSPSRQIINSYRKEYEQTLRKGGVVNLSRTPNGEYLSEELERKWKRYKSARQQNDLSL